MKIKIESEAWEDDILIAIVSTVSAVAIMLLLILIASYFI